MTAGTLAGMSQAPSVPSRARRATPATRPERQASSAETPPEADVAAMAAHLRVGVTRLARLLRRLGDTGLSPSQISALTSIERHGPLTLGALADHERVAPPSITKVVEKLVEAGLVAAGARRRRPPRRPGVGDHRPAHALLDEVRAPQGPVAGAAGWPISTPTSARRLAEALDVIDALTAWDGPA